MHCVLDDCRSVNSVIIIDVQLVYKAIYYIFPCIFTKVIWFCGRDSEDHS